MNRNVNENKFKRDSNGRKMKKKPNSFLHHFYPFDCYLERRRRKVRINSGIGRKQERAQFIWTGLKCVLEKKGIFSIFIFFISKMEKISSFLAPCCNLKCQKMMEGNLYFSIFSSFSLSLFPRIDRNTLVTRWWNGRQLQGARTLNTLSFDSISPSDFKSHVFRNRKRKRWRKKWIFTRSQRYINTWRMLSFHFLSNFISITFLSPLLSPRRRRKMEKKKNGLIEGVHFQIKFYGWEKEGKKWKVL